MRNGGLEEAQAGIKTARRNINNLRYADDTTLMPESEEELKSLLIKGKEESKKVGLKLNIQKTKIMASGPITSWEIDGETVETVSDFIFLGSKITADGDCSHEIKRCLLLGRKVMTNLHSIFKSRDRSPLRSGPEAIRSRSAVTGSVGSMVSARHSRGWCFFIRASCVPWQGTFGRAPTIYNGFWTNKIC